MIEKKHIKWIVGVLALAMFVPLAGCRDSDSIVGKWKNEDGEKLVFHEDGTGTSTGGTGAWAPQGAFTWKIEGNYVDRNGEDAHGKPWRQNDRYRLSEKTLYLGIRSYTWD